MVTLRLEKINYIAIIINLQKKNTMSDEIQKEESFFDKLKHKAEDLAHKAGDVFEDLKDKAEDAWDATKEKAAELKEMASEKIEEITHSNSDDAAKAAEEVKKD